MGNILTEDECTKRNEYIRKIKNLNFPILDIGTKNGMTGYLDFIKPTELGANNIMKGVDNWGRAFIIFKAEFEFEDGSKKQTFTTFFQRYNDNELLWHTCGHYGSIVINTEGGTSNDQFEMLYILLSEGKYEFTKENIEKLKLNLSRDKCPTCVKIGHTL